MIWMKQQQPSASSQVLESEALIPLVRADHLLMGRITTCTTDLEKNIVRAKGLEKKQ